MKINKYNQDLHFRWNDSCKTATFDMQLGVHGTAHGTAHGT